jgi:hypothetical protein
VRLGEQQTKMSDPLLTYGDAQFDDKGNPYCGRCAHVERRAANYGMHNVCRAAQQLFPNFDWRGHLINEQVVNGAVAPGWCPLRRLKQPKLPKSCVPCEHARIEGSEGKWHGNSYCRHPNMLFNHPRKLDNENEDRPEWCPIVKVKPKMVRKPKW